METRYDVLEDYYTADEKLCYLMECLKDPVAKEIMQESMIYEPDDYDKAGLTTLSTDFLQHVNTLKRYEDATMGQLVTAESLR